MGLSRRGLLAAGLLLPVGGLAYYPLRGLSAADGSDAVEAASPLGLADDLANPPEIHASEGVLRATLRMALQSVTLPDGATELRNYGALPGPTLRVHPGDTLEIRLENRLPPNPDRGTPVMNTPNRFNSTNLHFHGFHVSPRGNSDNVYLEIEPGQTFNYVVQLPDDHPAGTYWYHPHRHGSVAAQVASGAAGMMIVNGTLDEVPEVRDAVERILVVQAPIAVEGGLIESMDSIWELTAERDFLINGQYRPRIYLREGEVQHWRVLHAGDAQFLPFTLDGLTVLEIGRDGNPLDEPEEMTEVDLAPGNRVNLMVKAGKAGYYELRRPAFHQGIQALPEMHLADVIVLPADSDRVDPSIPMATALPSGPLPENRILTEITDEEIVAQRQFVLGTRTVEGMYKNMTFTINGEAFDPRRDDVVAKLKTAEEWVLINETPFPHPIHIHVNPFQVVAINGEPEEYKHWQDTIAVPAAGTVTIRTRFTDFTGRFVMHCHILPHEDLGMMLNINIEE